MQQVGVSQIEPTPLLLNEAKSLTLTLFSFTVERKLPVILFFHLLFILQIFSTIS